jgi:DNA-binding CsgD family transcriptional regulator
MTLYGTNLPVIVFCIIIIEIAILFNQWFIYRTRLNEKKRIYHLLLLFLLILFNLIEGIFPDKNITVVPPLLQNFLGFGYGYLFAAYCPFFFWRTMELHRLQFDGKYGFLFLVIPVILFYGILYPINRDITFTRKYIYIIPAIYAARLFAITIRAIYRAYRKDDNKSRFKERLLVYLSWIPVTIAPFMGAWLGLEKWIITTIINLGFLIVDPIYINQTIWLFRSEQDNHLDLINKLEEMNIVPSVMPADNFLKNCAAFGFTKREIEISELVAQGLEYKRIGELLFISEKTVAKHVQNIFFKASVTNKVSLINALNK